MASALSALPNRMLIAEMSARVIDRCRFLRLPLLGTPDLSWSWIALVFIGCTSYGRTYNCKGLCTVGSRLFQSPSFPPA
ncbi:hypothetical protein BDV12DRAFT_164266 [Aspergillus spectabilis]